MPSFRTSSESHTIVPQRARRHDRCLWRAIERSALLLLVCAAALACSSDPSDEEPARENDSASKQAQARPSNELIITAFDSAVWVPFDPNRPDAGGYAVLSGDPDRGPSQMLYRYGPGAGAMHQHSSDYQAVVIDGLPLHWAEGATEADAEPLGPGSYWSQPANQPHADQCLTDECLLFITWNGIMDSRPAGE